MEDRNANPFSSSVENRILHTGMLLCGVCYLWQFQRSIGLEHAWRKRRCCGALTILVGIYHDDRSDAKGPENTRGETTLTCPPEPSTQRARIRKMPDRLHSRAFSLLNLTLRNRNQ